MNWTYRGNEVTELPDDCVGFVYMITRTDTGRQYIGKKLSKFSKTTYKTVLQKNGKKKKKKIKSKIESDWQTYFGSSNELLADIAMLGEDKFTREILHYCRSKAECSYVEAREQFERKVLETKDYYNNIIQLRVHGSHIKNIEPTDTKSSPSL